MNRSKESPRMWQKWEKSGAIGTFESAQQLIAQRERGRNKSREIEPKFVQMPSREDMLQRLQEAGLYGSTHESDAFYGTFVNSVAESEKVGMGLALAWELAGYDTLRQYPPIMKVIMDMDFDRAIDAVTPDREVARDAKEFRKKVLEEAVAKAKAAEPKPEDLGPADSLNDLKRFSQAREIADIIFEYASSKISAPIWMEDRRKQNANPYYNQTHRGFFLEGYYGQINTLWTPWGKYEFGGSGSGYWGDTTPKILERLGAVVVRPLRHTEMGEVGPIWAVHSIDGVALPNPVEKPRSQFVPYEEAKSAWDNLKKRYEKNKISLQK